MEPAGMKSRCERSGRDGQQAANLTQPYRMSSLAPRTSLATAAVPRPLSLVPAPIYHSHISPFTLEASMETDWYNRAEAIQTRITQLRDSL
jgi:hypothetical protein